MTTTSLEPHQLALDQWVFDESLLAPGQVGAARVRPHPGTPLRQTTFVVVDLETTGGSAGADAITEIGAVKIRGGEVLGELATLVDPGRAIPRHITELTGIDAAAVRDAPRIAAVLPAFLEFARGAVLVAHNARFDIGFLRAAAEQIDTPWPAAQVLCTVKLARRVLPRDEVRNYKLGTLAAHFRADTTPTHRALDDARATVDVLHGLIGRIGNLGVETLEDLTGYLPAVRAPQRAKRTLADALPHAPGVYLFRGPNEEVLYVGTAVDLRRRVRSYFTGAETRTRMNEMLTLAVRVDHIECSGPLEAGVRELRLIAAHTPAYNRRAKYPRRRWWITRSREAFPRLVVTRSPAPGALGPFTAQSDARAVAAQVAEHCGLRTCTTRLRRGEVHGPRCSTGGELFGCPAAVGVDAAGYAAAVATAEQVLAGRDVSVLTAAVAAVDALAREARFERAARLRDRTVLLASALVRAERLRALVALDEFVVAAPARGGGWEVAIIRAGRLADARSVVPAVARLRLSAETVLPAAEALRGASVEEAALLLHWLRTEGARVVETEVGYAEPWPGAGRYVAWERAARDAAALGLELAVFG